MFVGCFNSNTRSLNCTVSLTLAVPFLCCCCITDTSMKKDTVRYVRSPGRWAFQGQYLGVESTTGSLETFESSGRSVKLL